MNFVTLGRSGLKVSRACLGTMTFGNTEWGTDEAESQRIVDAFIDAGHNFIDTADVYNAGVSEEIVGRAIASKRSRRRPRHQGVQRHGARAQRPGILPGPSDPCPGGQLAPTRYRLRRPLPAAQLGPRHADRGEHGHPRRLRAIGQGPLHRMLELLRQPAGRGPVGGRPPGGTPFVSLQPQYSLIWRDIELDILPTATRHGMGIIVWSPLGGGMLTGKYAKGGCAARRRPLEQRVGHGGRRA